MQRIIARSTKVACFCMYDCGDKACIDRWKRRAILSSTVEVKDKTMRCLVLSS
jgi:hypothetical protein